MKSSSMTIGQVAGHFGLPTHVLRHWESMGLLQPARVHGDRRRYTYDDLVRVASIVVVKRAGLSLVDIREFLGSMHTTTRNEVLRRNRDALRAKMTALRSALELLEAALDCPYNDITTCPIYRTNLAELVDTDSDTTRRVTG
ncbi:MerR family transcriptional regulator [Pseudonocardia spinosispora]|uniref:MerR family transcriptional regulator n=1 Tax=Pseudonocardia spinosispora TaxID=103441 RepID=UPI0007E8DEFD|nr:MerR family transcriptional regulator [Pseudonocardia spinosispora]